VLGLDARLYLPQAWTDDRPRCNQAGVPSEISYQPKWQLALTMLRRARDRGFCDPILADSLFGTVTAFREQLAADGRTYCVGIDSTLKMIAADANLGGIPKPSGCGRPPSRPRKVRAGAKPLSLREWALARAADLRNVTWREGTKGKMTGRFAAWRMRPAPKLSAGKEPLTACWLVAEWPEDVAQPTTYSFSNFPPATSLNPDYS